MHYERYNTEIDKMRRTELWRRLMLFLRSFVSLPEYIYRHLYFFGAFEIRTDETRFKFTHIGTPFENNIFWKGITKSWEYQSVLFWEKLARNSSVILDVGANSGFYSMVSKAINPSSKVFAFEPVPRNAEILKKNIELNDFDIELNQIAASNINGSQMMYDIPDIANNRQASLSNSNYDEGNTHAIQIESIKLDDFIRENNIDSLDLIKIDVEEHEVEVLEGFKESLTLYQPALLIEILNREISIKIEKLLREAGYAFFLNVSEETGLHEVSTLDPKFGRNFFCFTSQEHCQRLSSVNPFIKEGNF